MKTSPIRLLALSLSGFILLFITVKYGAGINPRYALSKVLWKLDPYHQLRTTLFGVGESVKEKMRERLINSEDRIYFPTQDKTTNYFREKWKFRPASTSQANGNPLVEDIDKDGIPDVFFSSESSKVYRLNGKNGEIVWEYVLPYGVTSWGGYFLADLDNDGMKEFIFGNTIAHPVRVYALRTGRNEKNRLYWKRNVSGDFFQAGMSFFRNSKGEIRIVAATRDAPYSRGSINILDGYGERVVPEKIGFDACNNVPTFMDINKDGELDILIGSHDFYGAKYADSLTAIDSLTGRTIWSTPVGADTGWVNFPIVDIDSDGEKEIIVPYVSREASEGAGLHLVQSEQYKFSIFTPQGDHKGEINGGSDFIAIFPNSAREMTMLYRDRSLLDRNPQKINRKKLGLSSLNLKTKKSNYILPLLKPSNIVSVLDIDDDNEPEVIAVLKIDGIQTLLVLNAITGNLKSIYQLNSKEEIKPKDPKEKLLNQLKDRAKKTFIHNMLLDQELLRNKVLAFEKERIAFLQSLDPLVLLKYLFNSPLPELDKELMVEALLGGIVADGIINGELVELDADGYWELIGMENPHGKLTIGTGNPKKDYYTAYDLPFPVLKGYDTNKTSMVFMKNLFKSREGKPMSSENHPL